MNSDPSFSSCRMVAVLLLGLTGCGGGNQTPQTADFSAQAGEKVAAFRRLADQLSKNPSAVAVAGALEEYRNIEFSAEQSPKEAEEILEIYRQRIQGKAGGQYAQEIQGEMTAVQAGLKRRK